MTKVVEHGHIYNNLSLEDLPGEVWKDSSCSGKIAEGFYSVSNFGRIKALERKVGHPNGGIAIKKSKIISQAVSLYGYLLCSFSFNNQRINYRAHRIIAECFLPNPFCKPYVNHIDGNKKNNFLSNLEWVTAKENSEHAVANNLMKPELGSNRPNAKITESNVVEILQMLDDGFRQQDIADKFSIGRGQISSIKRNKTWRHVNREKEFLPFKGEGSSLSKLKNSDVFEIREMLATGNYTNAQIAKKFNVRDNTISRIKTSVRWAHL